MSTYVLHEAYHLQRRGTRSFSVKYRDNKRVRKVLQMEHTANKVCNKLFPSCTVIAARNYSEDCVAALEMPQKQHTTRSDQLHVSALQAMSFVVITNGQANSIKLHVPDIAQNSAST
jgi:hypothetical protein